MGKVAPFSRFRVPGHSFKEPSITPLTKYFWKKGYTTSMGSVVKDDHGVLQLGIGKVSQGHLPGRIRVQRGGKGFGALHQHPPQVQLQRLPVCVGRYTKR